MTEKRMVIFQLYAEPKLKPIGPLEEKLSVNYACRAGISINHME
ncbi:hypothetical protein [Peribacillus deserti]|nr:hypothetical protein [Peribacillus deserti]